MDQEIDRVSNLREQVCTGQNERLLKGTQSAGALPACHYGYLSLMQERGMVDRELERLGDALEGAAEAFALRDDGRAALNILMNGRPRPEPLRTPEVQESEDEAPTP